MGEQFEQAKKLVHNHVLYGQSLLIEDMLKASLLPEEYIYPFVDEEVLEWWLVTPYLARKLKGQGEVILEAYDCNFFYIIIGILFDNERITQYFLSAMSRLLI